MNNAPHITFAYNKEKDIANIRIGIKLIAKGRQADRELQIIIDKYGNAVTNKQLATYIEDKLAGKDEAVQDIVHSLQKYWNSI